VTDLSDVLAGLNANLRKSILLGNEVFYERQALPSIGLTDALNGGLPYGRQVLVYGSKSSAKSSMMLETVAMAQKEGKVCAWIDAEMSYDSEWAGRLGVDTSQLIVSEARTVNDAIDISTDLMTAGADIIIIDSITSLLPGVYFDKGKMKELDGTGQMGQESKDWSRACKMLNYANNRTKPTLLVLISQARQNLQAYGMMTPTGGNAVKFYSSVVIKLTSNESATQAIMSNIPVGNNVIEMPVGRKVEWLITFSKTSPAFIGGEYNFYYNGDRVGIDTDGEVIATALKFGIIDKPPKSSWYTIYDAKVQGEAEAANYIRHNPEVKEKIVDEIRNLKLSVS
jgi:recombination protein RecA